MLTINNIVQSNSGSFNGTTGNATLGSGTTAGNTLILVVTTAGTVGSLVPTGFAADSSGTGTFQYVRLFHRGPGDGLAAGETSWTIVPNSTTLVTWAVFEVSNLDALVPKDGQGSTGENASATSIIAGNTTSIVPSAYDLMAISVHSAYNAVSASAPTWSGHTNSYTELKDQGAVGASTACGLSVSVRFFSAPTLASCTATQSGAAMAVTGLFVAYAAADAFRVIDADVIAGYEIGAMTVVANTLGYARVVAGAPQIVATTPRTGTYCLELSAVAATESVAWDGQTATTARVLYLPVHFPSALPANDVELASIAGTSHSTAIWFRVATSQIGVTVTYSATVGTEVLSVATVVPDTWHVVEVLLQTVTSTYTADWQLDGVDQTQATVAGLAGQTINLVTVGWRTATTATVRYDDTAVLLKAANYRSGNLRVEYLPVDPAGTLTLSGTSTNFQTFTANGTMAAWDATVAKANITESLPPVIGASAAGFAQVATATSDYVEIPITTWPGLVDRVRSVRLIADGWAASTTAANIRFRYWDGTTERIVSALTDSQYDNVQNWWTTAMCRTTGLGPEIPWTQARIDALTFRAGFSTDAAPACGIHWIGAEALIQPASIQRIINVEDEFFVDKYMDTESSAVLSYLITVPADRGATFRVTISGSPLTQYVAAGSAPYQYAVQAADFDTVTAAGLDPDPDPNLA